MAVALIVSGCGLNSTPAFTVSWEANGIKASCQRERVPSPIEKLAMVVETGMKLRKMVMAKNAINEQAVAMSGQTSDDVYAHVLGSGIDTVEPASAMGKYASAMKEHASFIKNQVTAMSEQISTVSAQVSAKDISQIVGQQVVEACIGVKEKDTK